MEKLEKMLKEKGAKKVVVSDLSRVDMAEAIEDAFRYDKMILAASTYDAGVFTPMQRFLNELQSKNYQNRKVGLIENGTWAPLAAKTMKETLDKMKDISVCEQVVTIKTKLTEESESQMKNLVGEILK